MAQCTKTLLSDGKIWWCRREKGHDGPHRDSRNVAWGFSKAEKDAMRTAEELVEDELEQMDE